MTAVSFYHLRRSSIEQALVMLLEKSLETGKRAVVRLGSEEELSAMDNALWTARPDSFIPHGAASGKLPAEQPVLLTAGRENPNKAEFVFVLPGGADESLEYYERIFFLFDGASENQVKTARERWKDFSGEGLTPEYWTQDENGKWQKKQ